MKYGFLITIPLGVVSLVMAGSLAAQTLSWQDALQLHPRIQVKAAEVVQQQWRVAELQADQGLDMRLATQGNLPLYEHYESDFKRMSEQKPYVDLLVEVKQTLFDSGAEQARIDAELEVLGQLQINYISAYEEQLHVLLTLLSQYYAAKHNEAVYQQVMAQLADIQAKQELRFHAGIGTLAEVRRNQLSQLQFEGQLAQLNTELAELERTVQLDYGLAITELNDFWQQFIANPIEVVKPVPANLRSARASQHNQQTIRRQMAAAQADNKPKIEGSLSYTFYDVTRGMHNQRLAGTMELSMPAFDNGRLQAKLAGLTQRLQMEQDRYHQTLLKKQVEFNVTGSNTMDLENLQQDNRQRIASLEAQLSHLMLAQGQTQTDLAGLADIYNQLAQTSLQMNENQKQLWQGYIKQLLLSEQLLPAVGIAEMDLQVAYEQ